MTRPAFHGRLRRLPRPADRRLAVRVTPDALRHVRAGHPWVFEESITSVSHEAAAGDLAVIFAPDRSFAAIGLYDPDSPIQVRILHAGRPATIDDTWWRACVAAALDERSAFTTHPDADLLAYRVLNGESDGTSGLVVDRYARVFVVKLYSPAWFPHLAAITRALFDVAGGDAAVVRMARTLQQRETFGLADGDVIAGDLPDGPVRFLEGGLWFEADVRTGQKTGHFLDQRANRLRVGAMVAGRDVLDVFASTGGFSVHAAAGGARSVHAVDLSAPTLAAAERNMALNADVPGVAACAFTTEVGDAFVVMDRLHRSRSAYDLVVVDPPSFARRAAEIDGALRAYARLTHLALGLLRPGGVLVQASCSSRVAAEQFFATVLGAFAAAGRPVEELARTGHDIDHPVRFREGEYLKAGFWRVGARHSTMR
jgi:23S rRNA (cytosine1962-C5)-methyltransferase